MRGARPVKRIIPLLLLLTTLLAACTTAQPTAAPPAVIDPTSTALVTNPPAATAASTAVTTQTSGAVTFNIVPEESKVTYEVGETFFNQNNRFNLAVGVTQTLSGSVFGDLSNPPVSSIGPIQVDISKFTSDSNRRDNAIRGEWLESTRFPVATFVSTSIEGLPPSYVEGQDYALKVTGDLTVREVTRSVTFDVITRLKGDTLSGSATTTILLSDFSIGPISIAGILKTEDEAKITLEFVARP
ncbi:YceI family protein [bacterium]|nr:YceI family protein [bacterium]